VIYLLDVNALLAMRYRNHVHHLRMMCWLSDLERHEAHTRFVTCTITELGFVRIAGNKNTNLALDVAGARSDLKRLKEEWSLGFLTDPLGAAHLPAWVGQPTQVTDGHLLALATGRGGRLATLDSAIPGALLIPQEPHGPMMVQEPRVPYGLSSQHASH
jgi:predicted nucleic acid-binding protein